MKTKHCEAVVRLSHCHESSFCKNKQTEHRMVCSKAGRKLKGKAPSSVCGGHTGCRTPDRGCGNPAPRLRNYLVCERSKVSEERMLFCTFKTKSQDLSGDNENIHQRDRYMSFPVPAPGLTPEAQICSSRRVPSAHPRPPCSSDTSRCGFLPTPGTQYSHHGLDFTADTSW